MSDRVYIGRQCASLSVPPAFDPISKIVVLVDADNAYEAGEDSGHVLELNCPYGSQALADKLLAKYKGFVYKPFSAGDVLIDPAAELGDGVNMGSVYSMLAEQDLVFDSLMASSIKAPGEAEVDSEYPFQTKEQQIERRLARAQSLITKTASEIRLEVSDANVKISALALTLDGVTITDDSGTTLIKGSSIDTSTIKAKSIEADKLNLTGAISFSDLSLSMQYEMDAIDETLAAWTYSGSTLIDGTKIMTGTVTASILRGGEVRLLTADEEDAGTIKLTGSSTSEYAVEFASNGALRLVSAAAFWVEAENCQFGTGENGFSCEANIVPYASAKFSLGASGLLWSQLYASTGTINTSDRQEKNSIDYDLSAYDALYDGLKPCAYKLNSGTSDRLHIGLIAQDVEAIMEEIGLSSLDFAGFIKSARPDGGSSYGLRYTEFIAMNIRQIQTLKARVAELERKLE